MAEERQNRDFTHCTQRWLEKHGLRRGFTVCHYSRAVIVYQYSGVKSQERNHSHHRLKEQLHRKIATWVGFPNWGGKFCQLEKAYKVPKVKKKNGAGLPHHLRSSVQKTMHKNRIQWNTKDKAVTGSCLGRLRLTIHMSSGTKQAKGGGKTNKEEGKGHSEKCAQHKIDICPNSWLINY